MISKEIDELISKRQIDGVSLTRENYNLFLSEVRQGLIKLDEMCSPTRAIYKGISVIESEYIPYRT